MNVAALGHVAIKVHDLKRAEAFYCGLLGLTISGHLGDDMTFFRASTDRFQELAVTAVEASGSERPSTGLDHVAFKIAGSLPELQEMKTHLESAGVVVAGPIDHTWSLSLYLQDPEGNGVELYVEQSDIWKHAHDFTPTANRVEL